MSATKLKGDIGQLMVAKELLILGWHISFPYGENLKYDLIAEKDGKFKRIQVKAVTPSNGVLKVNCRSSNNWSVTPYKPSDFEILAVADLRSQQVYFIPSDRINNALVSLRLTPTKNSQLKGVNYALNYKVLS